MTEASIVRLKSTQTRLVVFIRIMSGAGNASSLTLGCAQFLRSSAEHPTAGLMRCDDDSDFASLGWGCLSGAHAQGVQAVSAHGWHQATLPVRISPPNCVVPKKTPLSKCTISPRATKSPTPQCHKPVSCVDSGSTEKDNVPTQGHVVSGVGKRVGVLVGKRSMDVETLWPQN